MSKLQELQLAEAQAKEARWNMEMQEGQYRRARQEAFESELHAELAAKFGDSLKELREAQAAAEKAVLDERERLTLSGEGLKYPVGTVMVQWVRPRSYGRHVAPLEITGERGVIEVITSESTHPGRGRRASRGSVVIRLLKKDGSKGLKYVDRHWEMDRFFPDGVNPNKGEIACS